MTLAIIRDVRFAGFCWFFMFGVLIVRWNRLSSLSLFEFDLSRKIANACRYNPPFLTVQLSTKYDNFASITEVMEAQAAAERKAKHPEPAPPAAPTAVRPTSQPDDVV